MDLTTRGQISITTLENGKSVVVFQADGSYTTAQLDSWSTISQNHTWKVKELSSNAEVGMDALIYVTNTTTGGYRIMQGTIKVIDEANRNITIYLVGYSDGGASGDTAFLLDIDNEMTSIPIGSDGKVASAITLSFNLACYYGAKNVTSDCTISTSGTLPSGITVNLDTKSTPVITIAKDTEPAELTEITFQAVHSTYGTRTAVFSIAAVKSGGVGADAELQELLPSLSSISFARDTDGTTLTPASRTLTVKIKKTKGASTSEQTIAASGLSVRYSTTSMPTSSTAGTALDDNGITIQSSTDATSVYVAAFNSAGTLVDRETIPVIKDGAKGSAGAGVNSIEHYYIWWNSDTSAPSTSMSVSLSGSQWYNSDAGAWYGVMALTASQLLWMRGKVFSYSGNIQVNYTDGTRDYQFAKGSVLSDSKTVSQMQTYNYSGQTSYPITLTFVPVEGKMPPHVEGYDYLWIRTITKDDNGKTINDTGYLFSTKYGNDGSTGARGASYVKINTYERNFTLAEWQTYGATGHSEPWNVENYDNPDILVGDTGFITGIVSDQYTATGVHASAKIEGTVTSVTSTRITMTSTNLVMAGFIGDEGQAGYVYRPRGEFKTSVTYYFNSEYRDYVYLKNGDTVLYYAVANKGSVSGTWSAGDWVEIQNMGLIASDFVLSNNIQAKIMQVVSAKIDDLIVSRLEAVVGDIKKMTLNEDGNGSLCQYYDSGNIKLSISNGQIRSYKDDDAHTVNWWIGNDPSFNTTIVDEMYYTEIVLTLTNAMGEGIQTQGTLSGTTYYKCVTHTRPAYNGVHVNSTWDRTKYPTDSSYYIPDGIYTYSNKSAKYWDEDDSGNVIYMRYLLTFKDGFLESEEEFTFKL